MPTKEPTTITLPAEMSERIQAIIADRGYADPLAVMDVALDSFELPEAPLEPWMVQEIMDACDELDRDPTAVITLDQLGEELKLEYARELKAG